MGWDDPPTDRQLRAIRKMLGGRLYLKPVTRREASDLIGKLIEQSSRRRTRRSSKVGSTVGFRTGGRARFLTGRDPGR